MIILKFFNFSGIIGFAIKVIVPFYVLIQLLTFWAKGGAYAWVGTTLYCLLPLIVFIIYCVKVGPKIYELLTDPIRVKEVSTPDIGSVPRPFLTNHAEEKKAKVASNIKTCKETVESLSNQAQQAWLLSMEPMLRETLSLRISQEKYVDFKKAEILENNVAFVSHKLCLANKCAQKR